MLLNLTLISETLSLKISKVVIVFGKYENLEATPYYLL